MPSLSGLSGDTLKTAGRYIVDHMSPSEVAVVAAASQLIPRVFEVKSIASKAHKDMSHTTIYAAVHSLEAMGIFVIHKPKANQGKMANKILTMSFTIEGRSICEMAWQKNLENISGANNIQPQLI